MKSLEIEILGFFKMWKRWTIWRILIAKRMRILKMLPIGIHIKLVGIHIKYRRNFKFLYKKIKSRFRKKIAPSN